MPAIAVMNEILGGGFGSRLFQKVRTQLGLAYAVGGGFGLRYDHPGTFGVEVLTKSASTVDATKAAEAEIAGLTPSHSPQDELQRAKGRHPQLVPLPLRHQEKVLDERERLEFYGYPADYLETYQAGLEKVTARRRHRRREEVHSSRQLAVLVVGNGPEIKPRPRRARYGSAKAHRHHHPDAAGVQHRRARRSATIT